MGMESGREHNSHLVPYQRAHLLGVGQQPALQLPCLPLDFSFSFSDSWARCLFISVMPGASMCCRTTTSSREAMRTDMGLSLYVCQYGSLLYIHLPLLTACPLDSELQHQWTRGEDSSLTETIQTTTTV